MLLLIDNYDSFTYNLYQLIEELGTRCHVVRNDAVSVSKLRTLKPDYVVISPGPGTPDDAGISLQVIREFTGKIPILGVCLGHQSIGQVFGGRIVRAKRPMHGKISKVKHDRRTLFRGLETPFLAARYHSLVIEKASLPSCLEVTAVASDGEIMGVRHKRFIVEGVQFQPESIATAVGRELMRNFLMSKKEPRP